MKRAGGGGRPAARGRRTSAAELDRPPPPADLAERIEIATERRAAAVTLQARTRGVLQRRRSSSEDLASSDAGGDSGLGAGSRL
jgi:hypothetical protein